MLPRGAIPTPRPTQQHSRTSTTDAPYYLRYASPKANTPACAHPRQPTTPVLAAHTRLPSTLLAVVLAPRRSRRPMPGPRSASLPPIRQNTAKTSGIKPCWRRTGAEARGVLGKVRLHLHAGTRHGHAVLDALRWVPTYLPTYLHST